jgi:hypothetical protein
MERRRSLLINAAFRNNHVHLAADNHKIGFNDLVQQTRLNNCLKSLFTKKEKNTKKNREIEKTALINLNKQVKNASSNSVKF